MFHHIYLRTSSQATEDTEKVRSAFRLFLPQKDHAENDGPDIIHESIMSGHHGNPITILEAEIRNKTDCQYVVDQIRHHLGPEGLSNLITELPRRLDEDCTLYVRFDKQEASKGKLVMAQTSDAIVIRMKLKVYPAKQEKAILLAQGLFKTEG
jgi:RNA binding exosome subunit